MQNTLFYEAERPVSSPVAGGTIRRGGEVRLYKDIGYLIIDVAPDLKLIDEIGQKHTGGRTSVLAIELRENIGNTSLRDLLREASDLIDAEEVSG